MILFRKNINKELGASINIVDENELSHRADRSDHGSSSRMIIAEESSTIIGRLNGGEGHFCIDSERIR